MARLHANENFPLPAVEQLRRLGHDALTVAETGKAEQAWPDEDVLSFAAADNRILLTLNRKHFIRLHAARPTHAGIIVCTVDADFLGLTGRIDAELSRNADMRGQIVRVNRPSE